MTDQQIVRTVSTLGYGDLSTQLLELTRSLEFTTLTIKRRHVAESGFQRQHNQNANTCADIKQVVQLGFLSFTLEWGGPYTPPISFARQISNGVEEENSLPYVATTLVILVSARGPLGYRKAIFEATWPNVNIKKGKSMAKCQANLTATSN